MSAPLRPAEEIARGMVVSTMQNRITGKAVVALLCGGSRVYVDVDSDGEADDLRRLLTRLIEQSRAEGAAAERERLLALPEETPAEQEARHRRALRAARETSCENDLYREEQPRDIADRIRALVQERAGRWADADGAASDEAMGEVVEHLARVAQMVRRGVPVTKCIDDMRRAAVNVPWGDALRQAADEFEAIVREHEKEGDK